MSSTLVAHCGGQYTTRDGLRTLPKPEPMGPKHLPIPHHELVDTLDAVLSDRGIRIEREQFAVAREGRVLFATFDFAKDSPGLRACNPEQGHAMGLRGGNDQTLVLEGACARRMFVCDNLAFTKGLIHFKRKHTVGLDLKKELDGAVSRYVEQTTELEQFIEAAQEKVLTAEQAKMLIYQAFLENKVAPTRLLPKVHQTYFAPEETWTDVTQYQGRLWGLHNAFTRAVQELKPRTRFEAQAKLGGLLTLDV